MRGKRERYTYYDDYDDDREEGGGLLLPLILLVIVILLLTILYLVGTMYFRSHFMMGTVVNGMDVSRMTSEEVQERLSQEVSEYTLIVYERAADGSEMKETIGSGEIGLEMVFDTVLEDQLAKQSGIKWVKMMFDLDSPNLQANTALHYDSTAWQMKMDSMQCFDENFIKQPEDAYLSGYQDGTGFQIVPEVPGNQPNREIITAALEQAVLSLDSEIRLEEVPDAYRTPAITTADKDLQQQKQALDEVAGIKITYHFGDSTEVLDGDTIRNWISLGEDNQVILDESRVEAFVASLRKKYDTIFRPRIFMTSYGEEVEIEEGDYGWWMNYVQEQQELTAMIKAGESGERTPVYFQTAAQYGDEDYGDSYVEVNLTAQHIFCYKDGQLVLESDCVSGKATKDRQTPEGIYGITYKERNATLEGEGYSTPVMYWMPFNGNVGLHDASWRNKFGKNFYKSSGSHGCVNLPYLVAKELYGYVEKGTPVIVYSLEGTESKSVTKQGEDELVQAAIDAIDSIGTVEKTEACEKLIERARDQYNDLSRSGRKKVTNLDVLEAAEEAFDNLE